MNILKEVDTNLILKLIENSQEPFETKEIQDKLKKITRTKIMYRLNQLRAENLIKGKQIGAGKGSWIWWSVKK
jgi:predicted transcriptional regulator